jgi:hypothetical protein
MAAVTPVRFRMPSGRLSFANGRNGESAKGRRRERGMKRLHAQGPRQDLSPASRRVGP